MKIHFCDLCNESVPQSDLDEGRAFLRKGRVICASCDRSMSNEPSPSGGPFGQGVVDAGAQGPAAAGVAGAGAGAAPGRGAGPAHPAPGAGAPAPAPYQPVVYPAAAARTRGGSGAGLGLVALLFTGGLAFWVGGRMGTLETEMRLQTEQLADGQRDARLRFEQELERDRKSAGELGEGLRGELRELREWLNAELSENQLRGRQMDSRLEAFGARIEAMSEAFGNVGRHDQELMRLQQRYTTLAEAVEGFGKRLESQSERKLATPLAPAAAVAAQPAAPPPWMGLVEQLASPNTSERWQAVVALGETRDAAVSEFLVPALGDEDIFIRMVTARVLGDLGSPVGIPALIDALDDPESAVREAAYIALRAVTKRDLPFDPETEDTSDRARRIKAWRDWWEKEKGRFLEG